MERTFFAVLLIITVIVNSKKLSPEENQERVEKCGKTMLPIPEDTEDFQEGTDLSLDKDQWIVTVIDQEYDPPTYDAVGTFISPRHVITNSQPILTENLRFHWDKEKFKLKKICESRPEYMEVPEEYALQMKITSGFCRSERECEGFEKEDFKPVRAWFLKFCAQKPSIVKQMGIAMLIEIEQTTRRSFSCVADSATPLTTDEKVHIYGMNFTNGIEHLGQLKYRNQTNFTVIEDLIGVPNYYAPGDRGGPMVQMVSERATVIGVGGSAGWKTSEYEWTFFFRLQSFEALLCELAGICPLRFEEIEETTWTVETRTEENVVEKTSTSSTTSSKLPDPPLSKVSKAKEEEANLSGEDFEDVFMEGSLCWKGVWMTLVVLWIFMIWD